MVADTRRSTLGEPMVSTNVRTNRVLLRVGRSGRLTYYSIGWIPVEELAQHVDEGNERVVPKHSSPFPTGSGRRSPRAGEVLHRARSRLEGQASIRGGRGPPAASRALSQNGYGSNARTQQIFAARVRRDNYVLGTWYLVQSQRSTVMVVESCHPKGV